jgi:hypothetical protein
MHYHLAATYDHNAVPASNQPHNTSIHYNHSKPQTPHDTSQIHKTGNPLPKPSPVCSNQITPTKPLPQTPEPNLSNLQKPISAPPNFTKDVSPQPFHLPAAQTPNLQQQISNQRICIVAKRPPTPNLLPPPHSPQTPKFDQQSD